MGGTFYLFNVGPVPVHGSLWFFLLVAWIVSQHPLAEGLLLALALTFSILVHELGHAAVATRYRLSPHVVLLGFGGVCVHERPEKDVHAALITAAGPAAGLALGAFSLAASLGLAFAVPQLLEARPAITLGLGTLVFINFFWSAVNLLPLYPLDGGQLYRLGLLRVFARPATAERVTHGTGVVVAALLAGAAVLLSEPILAILALFLGVDNVRKLTATSASGPIYPQHRHARELLAEGEQALADGAFREAARLGHQMRALPSLPDDLAAHACELIAVGSLLAGRVDDGLAFAARAVETPRLAEALVRAHLDRHDPAAARDVVSWRVFGRLDRAVRDELLERLDRMSA